MAFYGINNLFGQTSRAESEKKEAREKEEQKKAEQAEQAETKEAAVQEKQTESQEQIQAEAQRQRLLQLQDKVAKRLEDFVRSTGREHAEASDADAEGLLNQLASAEGDSFTPENLQRLRQLSQSARNAMSSAQEARGEASKAGRDGKPPEAKPQVASTQDFELQARRAAQEIKNQAKQTEDAKPGSENRSQDAKARETESKAKAAGAEPGPAPEGGARPGQTPAGKEFPPAPPRPETLSSKEQPQTAARPGEAGQKTADSGGRTAQSGQPGRPGEAQANQPGRPGETQANQPGRPGEAQANQPGRPGEAQATQPGRPGEAHATQPGRPGEAQANLPGRPGETQANQPGRPGETQANPPGRPGESQANQPGRPGDPQSGQSGPPKGPQASRPGDHPDRTGQRPDGSKASEGLMGTASWNGGMAVGVRPGPPQFLRPGMQPGQPGAPTPGDPGADDRAPQAAEPSGPRADAPDATPRREGPQFGVQSAVPPLLRPGGGLARPAPTAPPAEKTPPETGKAAPEPEEPASRWNSTIRTPAGGALPVRPGPGSVAGSPREDLPEQPGEPAKHQARQKEGGDFTVHSPITGLPKGIESGPIRIPPPTGKDPDEKKNDTSRAGEEDPTGRDTGLGTRSRPIGRPGMHLPVNPVRGPREERGPVRDVHGWQPGVPEDGYGRSRPADQGTHFGYELLRRSPFKAEPEPGDPLAGLPGGGDDGGPHEAGPRKPGERIGTDSIPSGNGPFEGRDPGRPRPAPVFRRDGPPEGGKPAGDKHDHDGESPPPRVEFLRPRSQQQPGVPRPSDSSGRSLQPDGQTFQGVRPAGAPPPPQVHEAAERARMAAQILSGEAPGGFMPASAGPVGRVLDVSLPGEIRSVVASGGRQDDLGLIPRPTALMAAGLPRGAMTGGRPVTAQVPIYQPVLDMIYNIRGKGKVEGESTPIKMALSGSAGMLDRPTYTRREAPWAREAPPPDEAPEPGKPLQQQRAEIVQRRVQEQAPAATQQRVVDASESNPLLGTMTAAFMGPGEAARQDRQAPLPTKGEGAVARTEMEAQAVTEGGSARGRGSGGGSEGGEGGERRHGGGESRGSAGTGAPAGTPLKPEDQMRQQSYRLAASHEAFRITMDRMENQLTQRRYDMAVRTANTSIDTILRRIYRDQELSELDETEAVNSLVLMLKLGGDFTYSHSARVLDFAMDLADEMGITDEETRKQIELGALLKDVGEMGVLLGKEPDDKIEKIADFMSSQDMLRAGLLHDIGKLRIPPEILYKPGRMTEEEYAVMKMHPIYGEQMIYPIASLRHLCPTIRGHHERWDGRGYPDGLSGERIPLAARVLAVADVFDALHAERPYKSGMDLGRVREILNEGRGTHFDPDCLDAFMRVLDRRFPGAMPRRRALKMKLESVDA